MSADFRICPPRRGGLWVCRGFKLSTLPHSPSMHRNYVIFDVTVEDEESGDPGIVPKVQYFFQ